MTQFFLSHSTRDGKLCDWLRASAAEVDILLFLAEHDVPPGEHLAESICAAIDESDAVIVLISTNSANSAYVHQEVGYALKAKKVIIPLVQRGIEIESLAMLQGLKYIPFDFENPGRGRDHLFAKLREHIEQQEASKQMNRERVALICMGVALLLVLAADSKAPAIATS